MEQKMTYEERFEDANDFLRYREFDQACKIYEELINEGFYSPELYNNYGLALFYLDQLEEALKQFEKAISLDKSFSLPYTNIGLIYLNKEEYEKAVEYFLNSLKLEPNHPETLYNLAVTYYRMGDKTQALKFYEDFLNFAGDEHKALKESVSKIIAQIKQALQEG